jgi:hypothetical protein
VDGTGIAGGDQVVALCVFVDRVDVEVVPRIGRIVACACLARIQRENRL